MHGHGGVILEHLKAAVLHANLGSGDVFFWQTALSWMMWNFRIAGLLCGAQVICYSGHPLYPNADRLWQLIDDEKVSFFGTSPVTCWRPARRACIPARHTIWPGSTPSAVPVRHFRAISSIG